MKTADANQLTTRTMTSTARNDIHHPELSFEYPNTNRFIAAGFTEFI